MRSYNIYNKVKGLAVLVPLSALLFSSCSDFLEIKPQNEIVLEDFWNEKTDIDQIVAGCYSGLEADPLIRRMIVWGEARSENVMAGASIDKDVNLAYVLNENITAMNPYTTWDGFYNIINRCNTVINYAPTVAERDPGYTESEMNATIAEMVALRSLCYFYLIRTFRDVPYTEEVYLDDDQEMDLPATPFATILDNLINDLEKWKGYAITRYPTTKPLYQTGRITKCAFYAMLCEMYLWRGGINNSKADYQKCIEYAKWVIDDKLNLAKEQQSTSSSMSSLNSGNFERTNGYPLVNNAISSTTYGNAYNSIFVSGNSLETIFELVYDNDEAGNTMLGNSAVSVFYGNNTNAGHLQPSTVVIGDYSLTSGRTIYEDKNLKADARFFENCNTMSETIAKFTYRMIQIVSGASSPATWDNKYAYAKINNVDHHYNSSNWIIYRLSDIMLLAAEAYCMQAESGSTAEIEAANKTLLDAAFDLVQAVNNRSLAQTNITSVQLAREDYKTKSQMEDLIYRERQRELMFEGKRYYDLVRCSMREGNTQRLSQAMSKRDITNGEFVQNFFKKMDAIFWPINNDELKVNKNLKQNPSFGSGENQSYE